MQRKGRSGFCWEQDEAECGLAVVAAVAEEREEQKEAEVTMTEPLKPARARKLRG